MPVAIVSQGVRAVGCVQEQRFAVGTGVQYQRAAFGRSTPERARSACAIHTQATFDIKSPLDRPGRRVSARSSVRRSINIDLRSKV